MRGKLVKRRPLRPKVSMVFTAGKAKAKFTVIYSRQYVMTVIQDGFAPAPKPKLAKKACLSEKFACLKISVE